VNETEAEYGPVDILVNNAGCMYYTDMVSLHTEEWERQIDINCKVGLSKLCSVTPVFLIIPAMAEQLNG